MSKSYNYDSPVTCIFLNKAFCMYSEKSSFVKNYFLRQKIL